MAQQPRVQVTERPATREQYVRGVLGLVGHESVPVVAAACFARNFRMAAPFLSMLGCRDHAPRRVGLPRPLSTATSRRGGGSFGCSREAAL